MFVFRSEGRWCSSENEDRWLDISRPLVINVGYVAQSGGRSNSCVTG